MKSKTDRKLSKTFSIIALATILIGTSFTATQTANAAFPVIDFDSLANGTPVTTQFASQGAHFSSTAGSALIFEDVAEATSQKNILIGNNGGGVLLDNVQQPIWIDIVDAAGNPAVTDEVSFELISVGGSTVTVTAKSSVGNVVDTQLVGPQNPPCNGLGNQDAILITGVGAIASVHITIAQGACGTDGVGIDDLIIADLLEGCSPGFWKADAKTKYGAQNWVKFTPISDLEAEIGPIDDNIRVKGPNAGTPDKPTLLGALNAKGGNMNALVREVAAALLNIEDGSQNYPLTNGDLLALFAGLDQGNNADIEDLRAFLWDLNHAGCQLNHIPVV